MSKVGQREEKNILTQIFSSSIETSTFEINLLKKCSKSNVFDLVVGIEFVNEN